MPRGRFAPSPSGDLHLGNLRTALVAWCFAKHDNSTFFIRVEDLTTGAVPLRVAEQFEDLAAIGITSDEAVPAQSERADRYDEAIAALDARALVYRCFCSRRDIREAPTAPHGPSIEGAYPGTCADLPPELVAQRLDRGDPAAWRLRADGASVTVADPRCGVLTETVDDFVLRRADGLAAYNLAVVVDDADQGVEQVVRGNDLFHTTPRQVLLQQLLDLPTPGYRHLPLVHGADGSRLSKRHGSVTLRECVADGERVESVLGRLAASVGLAAAGESVDAATVLARFDPDRLTIADRLAPAVR